MGDSPEDEPGEILNRHAANLRGLALAERQDGDRATNDDIGAAVKPAVLIVTETECRAGGGLLAVTISWRS